MSWSKLSFLSFFRKSPKQLVVAKSNTENEIKAEKMVLTSVVRQSVARRIPLIKFRRQRQDEAALNANAAAGSATQQTSVSVSGVGVSRMQHIFFFSKCFMIFICFFSICIRS